MKKKVNQSNVHTKKNKTKTTTTKNNHNRNKNAMCLIWYVGELE